VAQDQEPRKRSAWQLLRGLYSPSIRGKIVLPYLLLTLAVASVGTYVVTRLVFSSLGERLNNQLLEAGRVVSDKLALRELAHIESARAVAFTVGLAEALQAGDRERLAALSLPAASVQGVECLIIYDTRGQETLHVLRRSDGTYETVDGQSGTPPWIVQSLLEAGDPNGLPRRSLGLHLTDQRYYYFTAIPVGLEGQVVGVTVVGTSLDTLLPYFKLSSLADVIVYLDGGRAVATTIALAEQSGSDETSLDNLSISPGLYESVLNSTEYTIMENIWIRERPYRFAYGALRVANDSLGTFAVVLPSNFIVERGITSRNTYALIFAAAMVGVVAIGYLIAQRITHPLSRLVRTSQAVSEGDLSQRTGIASADEIGVLATTFDVMTGRLAERTRTLEETLGRLRAILSSIGDGVLLEDREGDFIPLNAAAETLLKEMATDFPPSLLHELPTADQSQAASLEPIPWLLDRRRFEVGKKVISAQSAAVRTKEGESLGSVIVLRDVTAEAEAERLKDAFVAHVSHELRTPLTVIKGYGDLMLASSGEKLDGEQRGYLGRITHHTDNLVAMINALLDFSEMEANGRLRLVQRPMTLSTLVEEIAKEWRPQMEEKNLAFRLETPAALPLVNVDSRRLRWAIINLVRNACEYTPAGGSVTLRLSERDGWVVLDVVDTGIGISPQNQEQLFTRFYRVSGVSLGNMRGIGLGLYVTKSIAEAHGGEIHIVSAEGAGSTFSILLPALPD
jgi:two-component system sensor histidine kinase VicK